MFFTNRNVKSFKNEVPTSVDTFDCYHTQCECCVKYRSNKSTKAIRFFNNKLTNPNNPGVFETPLRTFVHFV